jgi:N6-adenosine-specific RNA methylase IME4
MTLTIDDEFKNLIPPLTADEYRGLEESILAEGCRDSLIAWHGILIDGHNRYSICEKYGLPFNVTETNFESRDAAIEWIIKNQFGRRNLPLYERARLALRLKPVIAERARENNRLGADMTNTGLQNSVKAVNTQQEIAKAAGVSHDTIAKVEKIEANATPETKEALRRGEMSINQAFREIQKNDQKAKREEAIQEQITKPKTSNHIDIYSTDKKYRVIYADPPWSYNDKQDTAYLGGAVKHYPTMPLEDICSIPVPAAKESVLFLWTTSPMLEDSFKVINAWGFKYKSSFIWDKVLHAMGHYNSVRHEFLLIATRGSCTPDVPKLLDSVVSIERTDHSRKPKEFRDIIDTLYPIGDRLEMFAREAPDGWDVWGNMA